MNTLNTVGHPTHRIDAEQRVTGTATYTGDMHLPGMLYARVLRSPHPHARIKSVDTSAAEALPGVKAILTRDNCDVIWSSGDSRNKRYLFNNPARYAGDAVAAVAAVDRHTAEQAIHLIQVEYETLPFVLDPEEALKDGASAIQPGGNLSPTPRGEHVPDVLKRGDVEAGFKAADRVFEDHYSSPHINNAPTGASCRHRDVGRRQAHCLRLHTGHRKLPDRYREGPEHAGGQSPRDLPVHGRRLWQQESESRF